MIHRRRKTIQHWKPSRRGGLHAQQSFFHSGLGLSEGPFLSNALRLAPLRTKKSNHHSQKRVR
jgi:hypothetical protein